MKAAVLYGKEQVRVEEVHPAPLKEGEVRIQIEAALTCGTDLKVYKRGYHARMIVPPAVFGHELAGLISEVGPAREPGREAPFTPSFAEPTEGGPTPLPGERGVSPARTADPVHGLKGQDLISRKSPVEEAGGTWRVGDRVVVANSAPCGKCFHCQKNQENLCEDLQFLNGAYAESIVVPERFVEKNLLRLKPGTAFADAALVEPLACAVQGVEDTGLAAGENVLILGAGPIGLMFLELARERGCEVTVAGRREARLRVAERLGAVSVIDVGEGHNLVTRVRNQSKTHFDAVIEAVGKPEAWEAAVHLVRKGGTVNFFGGCPSNTTITLDTTLVHYSNLKLLASFHHTPRTIRLALDHIEHGVVRAADFVDDECALSELPGLFKSMAAGNHAVKNLIRVHE